MEMLTALYGDLHINSALMTVQAQFEEKVKDTISANHLYYYLSTYSCKACDNGS